MSQRNAMNERSVAQRQGSAGGMTRKGATRVKPARAAANSVVVTSSSSKGRKANPATMTKEEKKAERRRERDQRDRLITASGILLKADEEYARRRKMWWLFMGLGVACTAVSFVFLVAIPNLFGAAEEWLSWAAMGSVVAAYAFIIFGAIYDWRKIRPLRQKSEKMAMGLTNKKIQQLIDEDYAQQAAKRAAKAEARASKRSGGTTVGTAE